MKVTELRVMDYLDWLTKRENDLLFEIETIGWPATTENMNKSILMGEELCMIREIKELVKGGHNGQAEG